MQGSSGHLGYGTGRYVLIWCISMLALIEQTARTEWSDGFLERARGCASITFHAASSWRCDPLRGCNLRRWVQQGEGRQSTTAPRHAGEQSPHGGRGAGTQQTSKE